MDEKLYLSEIENAISQYNKGNWTIEEVESCIELITSAFLYRMRQNTTR